MPLSPGLNQSMLFILLLILRLANRQTTSHSHMRARAPPSQNTVCERQWRLGKF